MGYQPADHTSESVSGLYSLSCSIVECVFAYVNSTVLITIAFIHFVFHFGRQKVNL